MSDIQKHTSNQTLAQRLANRRLSSKTTLLLDVSGSMYSDVEPGKTKIDALRDIVKDIPGSPAIFCFSDGIHGCQKNAIPAPHGGTRMSQALEFLKSKFHNKIIMITDGEAQDKEQTLESAKGMNIQILYIGAGQKPDFLDKLAAVAGSFCTKEDLKMTKELTSKLQLLLNAGQDNAGQVRQEGPICL